MKKVLSFVRLMRLFPTLAWVGASTFVGLAISANKAGWERVDYTTFALVVLGSIICHGLVSHCANDLMDWASGTDKASPGLFSGGSRVIPEGHLAPVEVERGLLVGIAAGVLVATLLFARLGEKALVAALVGFLAATSYSTPPLRLSYRPLAGEWIAVMPGLVACSIIAAEASYPAVDLSLSDLVLILASAVALVAHLMLHHVSDVDADLSAFPRKLTTPAFLFYRYALNPRLVAVSYWLLAMILCAWQGYYLLLMAMLIAIIRTMSVNVDDKKRLATVDKMLLSLLAVAIVSEALVLGTGLREINYVLHLLQ